MIHISEIETLIFDTEAVSVTGILLNELENSKVTVIFCNEKHMPSMYLQPIAGHSLQAGRIKEQIEWKNTTKGEVWAKIISIKIRNQAKVLEIIGKQNQAKWLYDQSLAVQQHDAGNREAICAKIYFSSCFDQFFSRQDDDSLNACLNYGYSILLSLCSQAIAAAGYALSIGIHHASTQNPYNFACDIMEPFRPLVDMTVITTYKGNFDHEMKEIFWNMPLTQIKYKERNYYLKTAIDMFSRDVFSALSNNGNTIYPVEFNV